MQMVRTQAQVINYKMNNCLGTIAAQLRHPEWAKYNNADRARKSTIALVRLSRQL